MTRTLMAMLIVAATGCASAAPPFRIYGSAGDLEQLAGRWNGEYIGNLEQGRRGSISFDLAAGSNYARGTVLMTPQGATRPYGRFEPGRPDLDRPVSPERPSDTLLTISFAWVTRGQVEGVLDPYWDPDRATTASTTFLGLAERDRIAGTFVTRYANRAPDTSGTWSVTRRAAR